MIVIPPFITRSSVILFLILIYKTMNKIISIYLFIIFLTGCNSELSEEVV
ncbi:lipoprotein, partial [Vibrio sp. 10N.261.46.B6]